MQLSPLQIVVLAVIAGFFVLWLVAQRKRRGQTWESLLTRLNPSLNGRAVSEYFPWKEGLSATPDEVWDNMHGLKGVFTIYRNAQVMLDIADFVYRNYEGVDLVTSLSEARALNLGDLPVRIITHGRSDPAALGMSIENAGVAELVWQLGQQRLQQLSSHTVLVVAHKSGHAIPWQQPELVLDAVRELLAAS